MAGAERGTVATAAPGALLSAQRMLMTEWQHKKRVQTCAWSWAVDNKRLVCSGVAFVKPLQLLNDDVVYRAGRVARDCFG